MTLVAPIVPWLISDERDWVPELFFGSVQGTGCPKPCKGYDQFWRILLTPSSRANLYFQIREWVIIALRCVYVGIMVGGVVPLLFGLLYEMIMLLPLRVPLNHTPVLLLWQVCVSSKFSV